MSRITGGSATFEQSRKLAEYENRKVTINFSVTEDEGEGAEEKVIEALGIAKRKVFEELGLTKPEPVIEKPKAPKPTKKPPVVVDSAKDDPANIGGEEAPPNISTSPEDRKDPADMGGDDFTGEAPEITDAALSDAVTRKAAALAEKIGDKGPPMIRKLIGTFVGAGKHMHQIPQDARQKFLDDLEGLKA